jgi:hypothetical protein
LPIGNLFNPIPIPGFDPKSDCLDVILVGWGLMSDDWLVLIVWVGNFRPVFLNVSGLFCLFKLVSILFTG